MKEDLSVVGRDVAPVYAADKSAGAVKFPADISLPRMLWMKLARSPHAHARILAIDASAAEKMWGVVKVMTHKDVPKVLFGPYKDELYPLDEEVSFVGDSVAAVVAEDWNIAEEAARAIRVQYEPLPAVFDTEAAACDGAPMSVMHLPNSGPEWWKNDSGGAGREKYTNVMGGANETPTWINQRGDLAKGFGDSDLVVERVFRQAHVSGVPHEPRGCVALYENNQCTLWCSVQDPFKVQSAVAKVLGLPKESVRVVSTIVGGGFGVKVLGRFAVLAALMARETGRPVKVWFTREEESLDSHNRSALVHYVKAGAKKDGGLAAFKVRTYMDNGFWMFGGLGENIAKAICTRPMDLYHRCPNVLWEVFTVRTNHPSTGPYRGRADAESHFAVETVMDELAHGIGMDPLEFRLKNRIHPGDPLCSVAGKVMSAVGVEEAARQGARTIGWNRRKTTTGSDRAGRKRGIGMAMVIHSCGSNPSGSSEARIEIDGHGVISLFSGTPDQGAEQQTTLRQMVAEVLRVPLNAIGGNNADTANCPFDSGPYSSRTVYCAGIAATRAAEAMKQTLFSRGAESLEAPQEQLTLADGFVAVCGAPVRKVAFADLAAANGGVLQTVYRYNSQDETLFAYGFAAAFAEVEVDIGTGEVKICRFVSSHDVGRAINPMIVEGQIRGGVAQGFGYAMSEGFRFDPRTGTPLNQWFLDLKTPSILDIPDIEPIMVELGEPTHPFGAKGCSEIPYVGVAPAIANAIYNATGARIYELPMSPDRVLRALATVNGGGH
jgi:xanthine dehydrogenase molybdenum-binding subunit